MKYNYIMSFEQTLKSIDDTLRTDAGCSTPIDYIEQTSWILFLKYLSDLEKERMDEAVLKAQDYQQRVESFELFSF